jgi:hypothetical protein
MDFDLIIIMYTQLSVLRKGEGHTDIEKKKHGCCGFAL